MDCHRFKELLSDYLAGALTEETFAQMVAHEADCPACQTLAASAMPDTAGEGEADETWLAATLERTIGSDCRFIERRLAEQVDGALDERTQHLVQQHLEACPACRAFARVMEDLPDYCAAFPHLRPDRAFLRHVLRLTLPPRPSILDVVRALCRKPEALWEGAIVCALLLTPFAGEALPHWSQLAQRTTQAVHERLALTQLADSLRGEVVATQSELASIYTSGRDHVRARFGSTKVRVDQALDELSSTIDSKAPQRAAEILRALDREETQDENDQPTLPAGSSDAEK